MPTPWSGPRRVACGFAEATRLVDARCLTRHAQRSPGHDSGTAARRGR